MLDYYANELENSIEPLINILRDFVIINAKPTILINTLDFDLRHDSVHFLMTFLNV